ncbi:hypothetical protein [Teredinibacter waterburyi]|uniref:hypothetical protein n=1 Tax=Teredinibacter waterburyi TaxID=1500538 RepID=UPI00165EE0BF|nr:hypothetical protein [Teredinibacter waterburyi]
MISSQWLKLKNYVYFAETEDGVLFEAGAKTFALKGKGLYPLVSRVIHFMDSGSDRESIINNLPDKIAPFVNRLFEELTAHDMLIDATAEKAICEQFGENSETLEFLRFLQDNLDSEYLTEFNRWRETRIVLVGNGHTLKSTLNGLVMSGIGHVDILFTGMETSRLKLAEFQQLLDSRAKDDSGFSYTLLNEDMLNQQLSSGRQEFVLFAADEVQVLDRFVSDSASIRLNNHAFMVASSTRNHGFVSPLNEQGFTNYLDFLNWLPANFDYDQDSLHSPASHALIGSVCAYSFINHFFNIYKSEMRNHCAIISPWLDVDYHPILPVATLDRNAPLNPIDFRVEFEVPDGRPVSDYETLLMNLAPSFDEILGPFSPEPSKRLKQLPLYHDAIRIRYPRSANAANQDVHGWGTSAQDAGMRTLSRSLTQYAKTLFNINDSNIVSSYDYESWKQLATTLAVINSAEFKQHSVSYYAFPDELENEEVQMLLRVLRLYQPQRIKVELFREPGIRAWAARAVADTNILGLGYGVDAITAISEALGAACSRFQLPDLEHRSDIDIITSFQTATSYLSGKALDDMGSEQLIPINVTEQLLDTVFTTNSYVVGSVTIARSA